MQTLFVRVVVFVIGVLIGLCGVAGVLFLLKDGMTGNPVEQTQSTQRAESVPLEGTSSDDRDNTPPYNAVVPSRIDDIVFPKRTFNLKAGIVFWVATLTDEQIVELLEQSTQTSWNVSFANRKELQTTLLQKLSTTAPVRALNFALEREPYQRNSMIRRVYAAWARNDLNKAIERAKALNEQDSRSALAAILDARTDLPIERRRDIGNELGDKQYAFYSHFGDLTKNQIDNPRETWYEIVDLANRESVQEEAEDALNRVAFVWLEKEGIQILDEIVSSISDDYDYYFVLDGLFDDLSSDQSQEVFDFVMGNLGDRAIELIQDSGLADNWARQDPEKMLAKVKTLPASDFRQDLFRMSVRRWAEKKPQQILEQLEQLPLGLRVYASERAIDQFTENSPTAAAQFVLQIPDEDMRRQLSSRLVVQWTKEDTDAVQAWVLNLPSNDPIRASLMNSLKWRLIATNPRDAFALALQQPIADGSEDVVLDRIADDDVQLALELLPQVRETRKVSAYTWIGISLVKQGFVQRALDLANELDPTEQASFYQGIAMNWVQHDPKRLLRVFDDFPTAVKSKIAVGLKILNELTNDYSDEEITHLERHINEKDQELFEQVQKIDLDDPSEEEEELLEHLHLW